MSRRREHAATTHMLGFLAPAGLIALSGLFVLNTRADDGLPAKRFVQQASQPGESLSIQVQGRQVRLVERAAVRRLDGEFSPAASYAQHTKPILPVVGTETRRALWHEFKRRRTETRPVISGGGSGASHVFYEQADTSAFLPCKHSSCSFGDEYLFELLPEGTALGITEIDDLALANFSLWDVPTTYDPTILLTVQRKVTLQPRPDLVDVDS